MKYPQRIFPKVTASLSAKLCKGYLWVLPWIVLGTTCLQGQEISVSDAVISISEGVSISTGGGVHLQVGGAIRNDGALELKGDWENNGDGLVQGGKGKVTLNGGTQEIGGTQPSEFHVLVLDGGTKCLAADIQVSRLFEHGGCVVFKNAHALRTPNETISISIVWATLETQVELPVETGSVFTWPGGASDGPHSWFKASAGMASVVTGSRSGNARPAQAGKPYPNEERLTLTEQGWSSLVNGHSLPRQSYLANMMTIHFSGVNALAFAIGNENTPCAIRHGRGHNNEMQLSEGSEVASRSFLIDSERIYLI